MTTLSECRGFKRNSAGDIAEMPACTDYCRECGAHISDHHKTPIYDEVAELDKLGFFDAYKFGAAAKTGPGEKGS